MLWQTPPKKFASEEFIWSCHTMEQGFAVIFMIFAALELKA